MRYYPDMPQSSDVIFGWSQSTLGSILQAYTYDVDNLLLTVRYAGGQSNVFYNVPMSTARALYYAVCPDKYYTGTIENYGTLLLADDYLPLATEDGKLLAATW